jgi:flavin-dependent dehydrogenase
MQKRYDVIVIGAGPSGSTAANLLAQQGISVLTLERQVFPRFHIGESLLPIDLPLFTRLGLDASTQGFVRKAGAEFLHEAIGGRMTYTFADALPGTPDHAYQVERSVFDHWLARRAEEVGAEIHYDERVVECDVQEGHVSVTTTAGSYEARYVVDASGQDAFFGRRDKSVEMIEDFGLAAAFTHLHDVDPGVERELLHDAGGSIRILYVEKGWCWLIPLGGRRVSVGLVSRVKGLTPEWLDEQIASSPFVSGVARGARRPKRPVLFGSFSFQNKRHHGARWTTLGDAGCFLDPVFSSGVSLGMLSGELLAHVLAQALKAGTEAAPDLMDDHQRHMGVGYNVFATLIKTFYHSDLLHDLVFSKDQDPALRKGLTSVLAGDLWRTDNPFQNMLMGSQRRAKTLVPDARIMTVGA